MNKIYIEITDHIPKLRQAAFRFTNDKNEVDEVVQEVLLYFLTMNPATLKKIYDTDKIKGVISYACIMIKRNLTCKNNKYYYKINKYYSKINSIYTTSSSGKTSLKIEDDFPDWHKDLYNIPDESEPGRYLKLELIDKALDDFYWYDREIFKLYYYEGNTLDKLAAKTKISRNSLFTTIDKVRNKLKKLLYECKEE
jgi:RNA polymerase sigma factor (sigma-70 family)|tara:strand:+ start:244 stop:831 length:588 start_codon:yes stop_codon:yes gene_type:complete